MVVYSQVKPHWLRFEKKTLKNGERNDNSAKGCVRRGRRMSRLHIFIPCHDCYALVELSVCTCTQLSLGSLVHFLKSGTQDGAV